MATRRLAVFATAAAVLLTAAPLSAQLQPTYTWTADRPDGIGPIGISGDRNYPQGTLELSYRFTGMAFDGEQIGTAPISQTQALDLFFIAPTRQDVTMHLFGAALGLTHRITVEGQLPFLVAKTMDQVTGDGQSFTNKTGGTLDKNRHGFGDAKLLAHLLVYDEGSYRAHVTMGVSAPLGSIYQQVTTPVSAPNETRAPYPMQIGSGTWDLLPGFTFTAMNEEASTGLQVNTVFRFQDNSLGYRLGNRYQGSLWGAYKVSDLVSVSGRLTVTRTGDVRGADAILDPSVNPADDPSLQGGTEVEMPFGMNIYFPYGFLKGHRVGVEASIPLYQNLHGPQLKHGWTLVLGWQYAF